MKTIAVIHNLPVELYPPVTNLLDESKKYSLRVSLFTTRDNKGRKAYQNPAIKIIRFPTAGTESATRRLLKYLWFNFGVLYRLIRLKPHKVLYFETQSSYPVYLYKKYFNRRVEVYIHCHEYYSPDWYVRYTKLLQHYHAREKSFLYRHAKWISQTNEDRLSFFLKDHPFLQQEQLRVMPNYPPASWQLPPPRPGAAGKPVRCVYVGSLSRQTTYIAEFCDWITQQQGRLTFDIYSFNCDPATASYLQGLDSQLVRFFPDGIAYENIPAALRNYDVGILLYKAETLNVKYCAPNKLFEYLVCGLDVWFSEEMIGSYGFINMSTFPKVLKVNFMDLQNFDYMHAINRDGLPQRLYNMSCSQAVGPLLTELSGN